MLTDQLLPGNAAVSSRLSGFTLRPIYVRNLFAAWDKHRRNRLPKELTALSDEMLLDIGIDPRRVPNPAGGLIPWPELTRSGLATPIWRTTAKS